MDKVKLRLDALRDSLASSLWLLPAVAVAAGVAGGEWFGRLGDVGSDLTFVFVGSADSARAILSTIAGSTITVTSLTFTLTVVALQVASGQFTPRLMRTFLSDRGNQMVLAIFIGTFAYSLTLLRHVQAESDLFARRIPSVGVTVAVVLSLLAISALVYFIHHLTMQLRVDRVMEDIANRTIRVIHDTFEPATIEDDPPGNLGVPTHPVVIAAPVSGHLNGIATERLVRKAEAANLSVRLRPALGQWVVAGTTLGWAWRTTLREVDARDDDADVAGDQAQDPSDDGDLTETVVVDARELPDDVVATTRAVVVDNVHLGRSRTMEGDAAFGIRQLVDIAIRALSPGINDPTTAVQALRQMSRVLTELSNRDTGPLIRRAGTGFVVLPRPSFASHMLLATDQIIRYGGREPAVLHGIALLLHDLAEVCDNDARRDVIRDHAGRVEATLAAATLPDSAAAPVHQALAAVHATLSSRQAIMPAHAT